MPRSLRPNLPGLPFHLLTRLQGRVALFRSIEPEVVQCIWEHAGRADGRLVAWAVMPTHLHIVYVQGPRPLASFMQPLLRQLAVIVHKRGRSRGHVFERRYHASVCNTATYARTAILYVHRNPVKGKLCASMDDYEWTSHRAYCRAADGGAPEGVLDGLRLFASAPGAELDRLVESYRDRTALAIQYPASLKQLMSVCPIGDEFWWQKFGPACDGVTPSARPKTDLRDLAVIVISEMAEGMSLDMLRSGGRGRGLVAVRKEFIARAKQQGHRGFRIARFLKVSDATVANY